MVGATLITTGHMDGITHTILGDGITHGDTTVGDGPDTMAGATLTTDGGMLAIMAGAAITVIGTVPTITTTDTTAEIMPTCPEEEAIPTTTVLDWPPEAIEAPVHTEPIVDAPMQQWPETIWPIEAPEATEVALLLEGP
ncbi:hypothetical protein D2U88_06790 [Flagellimonas aequoris]|uniref:Uncharacterized protein n=1 Tax=Flagellimonas aequoris TaxID=2306997 RepID=A0A418N972_9FLAO|nr:hypothetical protein D2U88_06790 [Allomuricauda aequoris]